MDSPSKITTEVSIRTTRTSNQSKMPEHRNLSNADCASQHGCDAEERSGAVSREEGE
jgi:hypothetical protein